MSNLGGPRAQQDFSLDFVKPQRYFHRHFVHNARHLCLLGNELMLCCL